jgi:hypothetical protein
VSTPHADDDSKQHSEDKAHKAMTCDNRRHVAELIALIFYVIVDAFGIWPLSHFWAIFSGAVSAELPIKWGIAASASIFAIAALVYFSTNLAGGDRNAWLAASGQRADA